jgi:Phage capsid family
MLAAMNPRPEGIPLRPDPALATERTMASLARACVCLSHAVYAPGLPALEAFVHERGWQGDRANAILTRAATTPAMTGTTGWAKELAEVSVAFLRSLVPMSAAAQLLEQCVALSFGTSASIHLPVISAGSASFVAEGQPIRVGKLPTGPGPSMEPCKFATIVELTREMLNSSNSETIMRQALVDAAAASLDAALFSNTAAVAGLHPPGILVGATTVAPSADTNKTSAMDDDLSALVQAIAAYAGNGSIAFVAAPAQATRILLRAEKMPGPVLMSSALSAKTVIAIATNALAGALEPTEIDVSRSATFHEEDTTPLPIVGAGGQVAAPARSLFQTDCVALRLRLPVSWITRANGAVAIVSNTVW